MGHLELYSRFLQLPPSLLQFHSFLVALEDMANEDSPSGLIQPLLFSINNTNYDIFLINNSTDDNNNNNNENN